MSIRTISNTFAVTTVEDGFSYQIESDTGSVTVESGGSGTLTANLSFYSREGSADRQALSCYSCVFLKTASGYAIVSTDYYNRYYSVKATTGKITALPVSPSTLSVVVCIYSNMTQEHSGYLTELEIPVHRNGAKGDTNKRMPYFAGTLTEVSGTSIIATDYSTPYVDLQTGTEGHPVCYVYVGANTSTDGIVRFKPYPTTTNAYTSSAEWERMTDSFRWLIAQGIFTAYATLGNWIFNGNSMFSERGVDGNGNEVSRGSLDYVGIDEAGNEFTPNASLDAFTGEASLSRDKVRFKPDGSGWLAGQKIAWDSAGNASFDGAVRTRSLGVDFADIRDYFDEGGLTRAFVVGVDTVIYDSGGDIVEDIDGVWNFTVGAQTVLLPTNAYSHYGQRVMLYNPYFGEAGSNATTVRAAEMDRSGNVTAYRQFRGVGLPSAGTITHPVPSDSYDPVKEITFINGVLELMCVPRIDQQSGTSCDWAVVNIGTNVYNISDQVINN